MLKIEIAWTGEGPDGQKRQIRARSHADDWIFSTRAKRFDEWEVLASPSIEEWRMLLDGLRRRRGRHLAGAKDEARLLARIRRLFPGEPVG
jgi:hypothetical protein